MQAGGGRGGRALGGIREVLRGPSWGPLTPASDRHSRPPSAHDQGPTCAGAALSPIPRDPPTHCKAPAHVPFQATSHSGQRMPGHILCPRPHPLSQNKMQTLVSTSPLYQEPSTWTLEPTCPCLCTLQSAPGPLHGFFPLLVFTFGSVLGLCLPPSVIPHFLSTHCRQFLG